ncbi:glycosyltransferase family 2 protein [Dysgonomonas sp. ZJ279]|uniref:glycosyltransferase family 2 protein n=1 Tax=Dysgonomonas sp. ZJ279 TaxID=2709796 RepID=UPI0013E9BE58|nr:glycosyltransferase family 2 protein [Dysgonomonas sp. ZJ279]
MDKPIISVVISAYNRPDLLYKTLSSVREQTFDKIEVLVVDDGSEEDLLPIISSFKDDRIKYFKLRHQNANVARNYGIKNSRGKYIAMLDSDDLWLKDHLKDCINSIADSDGLYGSLIIRHLETGNERIVYAREREEKELMINYLLSNGYGAQTSTLFLTTESAKSLLWDEELERHQDYDFIVRYSKEYKLKAKIKPTVIFTLINKTNQIDFNSCIKFIKKNKNDILPLLYVGYNLNMFLLAINQNASKNILKYYQQESTRYKEHLPFHKYLLIYQPKTKRYRCALKIKYLFYILRM